MIVLRALRTFNTRADLDAVAGPLNGRPRKTLGWKTQPSACMNCSWPDQHDHVLRRPLEIAEYRRGLRTHASRIDRNLHPSWATERMRSALHP
ncbi:hypothetical protein DEJ46_07480 [Streptomyces venezuelae]|uniref:Uncharacterized protein n=1 Tax=Streptomyces venezuelae TaxID=54571 RepID=A0A5P2AM96_STRVZ|nr:hypothetical protein DEJ46_07480 [Streptomyces venezuelae]